MLTLNISYRSIVAVGLALLSVFLLVRLWPIVLMVCVALILMGALLPALNALVRRGMPRTPAVLLLLLAVLVVIGLLGVVTVPALASQFTALVTDLPGQAHRLDERLASYGVNASLEQRVREMNWGRLLAGSANYGRAVAGVLFGVLTVSVLTAYMLADAPRLEATLFRYMPRDRWRHARYLLPALRRVVGGYVRGQAITSAAIAVFTTTLLLILGVPNALAYGVLAAFFDIIPIVGALAATVPPLIAAFQVSTQDAVIVLIALIAYQQFEDRFLAPRVYGSTLNLSPLAVFLASLCGAQLLGVLGVLLALPVAAAGRVIFEYWYEQRTRGTADRAAPPLPDDTAAALAE